MTLTRERKSEEPQPSREQPQGRLWRLFLAGPVIYSLYFVIVYTLAEFGCFAGIQQFNFFGWNPIRIGILLFTIIGAVAIASIGIFTFRRWRKLNEGRENPEEDDPLFMLLVGVWLSGMFTAVTILSAVPMLLGSACDWI